MKSVWEKLELPQPQCNLCSLILLHVVYVELQLGKKFDVRSYMYILN